MGPSVRPATDGPKSLPRLKVTSRRNRLLELEDRIFTDRRLRFYGYGVVRSLAIYISLVIFPRRMGYRLFRQKAGLLSTSAGYG